MGNIDSSTRENALSNVTKAEQILNELYRTKENSMKLEQKMWMHRVLMTTEDVPGRVLQKYLWYSNPGQICFGTGSIPHRNYHYGGCDDTICSLVRATVWKGV